MGEEKYYRISIGDYDAICEEIINAIESLKAQDYTTAAFYLGKSYGAFRCVIEKDEG